MPAAPDISVILPTRDRPERLATCLRLLGGQDLPASRFEVIAALDGPDPASHAAAERVAREVGLPLRVLPCEHRGIGHAKNACLAAALGRWVVSINDDVLPGPGFLSAHLRAQEEASSRLATGALGPRGAMALGASPWVVRAGGTLFDRMVRETSMIFFYDRMSDAAGERWRDWGFRHAWNLNLSFPLEAAREVGGYAVWPQPWYEDIELAHRLARRFSMPVLFRPEAHAPHDHPHTPAGYLEREARLGFAAWGAAFAAPAFAAEVFRRDLRDPEEARAAERQANESRAEAALLTEELLAAGRTPDDARVGPERVRAMYDRHVPLKRWCWRVGFVAAAQGRPAGTAVAEVRALLADAGADAGSAAA